MIKKWEVIIVGVNGETVKSVKQGVLFETVFTFGVFFLLFLIPVIILVFGAGEETVGGNVALMVDTVILVSVSVFGIVSYFKNVKTALRKNGLKG